MKNAMMRRVKNPNPREFGAELATSSMVVTGVVVMMGAEVIDALVIAPDEIG